jgi:hypothetical protein
MGSLAAMVAACAILPASSLAQLSFQGHQVAQSTSGIAVSAHDDFNNDGREDIVSGNQLYLSNGDGTYAAPIPLPASVKAIGDFNQDGKLDFVSFPQTSSSLGVSVYLGNGNGTFQSPKTAIATAPYLLAVADMNHDGKTDLIAVTETSTGSGYPTTIQIWLSNGEGTFTKGQSITTMNPNPTDSAVEITQVIAGDFDGDGKPDIALIYNFIGETTVQVFYGDGAGHLGSSSYITDPNGSIDLPISAADVNNDGRSDLIAPANTTGPRYGDLTPLPKLSLFTGNANRTMSYKAIATTQCPESGDVAVLPAVADFNGDGINDLVFAESSCSQSSANTSIVFRPGESSGSFGAESTISQVIGQTSAPYAVRTTAGTKPDIIFTEASGSSGTALFLLTNTSTGSFPGCGLSGIAEGVQICSPGTSAASPVKFSVAAAGPTPMRTAAVWVDGKKVAEQLTHAFSNYSFLDTSLSLAAGSHAVTVFGTGWDNTLQKKSFTLTVTSAASCSAPASPGVHVCAPAGGTTITSPVRIQAASTITGKLARMEVWVDGVKKYTETTSTSLNTTLSLGAGTHRFTVFAVNTAGAKWEQVVTATVK